MVFNSVYFVFKLKYLPLKSGQKIIYQIFESLNKTLNQKNIKILDFIEKFLIENWIKLNLHFLFKILF